MSHVIVRYKVKEGRADENAGLIEKVFAELAETKPSGLRYAAFRGEDGTFVHVASIETDDGSNPLQKTEAFKKFTADIKERCDEPPAPLGVTPVGSYGFGDS